MAKTEHGKKSEAAETPAKGQSNTTNQPVAQATVEGKAEAAKTGDPAGVQQDTKALVKKEEAALSIPENATPKERLMVLLSNSGATAHRRNMMLADERPTQDQLMGVVESLTAPLQKQVLDIIKRANPRKPGMHTVNTGFTPIEMKLNQGTGSDPIRPRNSIPGHFYTGDSRALEERFDGLVIGLYQGRTLWPERDAQGDASSKAPICVSLDREQGSKYGACAQCYYAPKPYNEGGCATDVTVFFLDRDLTGIYSIKFSKSSIGGGEGLVKVLRKQEKPWARWVRFESQEAKKGDKRWFTIKAVPVSDPKNRDMEIPPAELDPLLGLLSAIVDYDVYYPAIVDTYSRFKNNPASAPTGEALGGEQFNEKLLEGGTPSDNADFSKGI